MVRKNLIVVGLVAALFAIPVHADDGQATEPHLSAVSMHIGGGIGVPMDPTGNFAGAGGTFQAGAGPNLGATIRSWGNSYGMYYRHAELKNFAVPPGTPCVPPWR